MGELNFLIKKIKKNKILEIKTWVAKRKEKKEKRKKGKKENQTNNQC
jgi:hypothetical protein